MQIQLNFSECNKFKIYFYCDLHFSKYRNR